MQITETTRWPLRSLDILTLSGRRSWRFGAHLLSLPLGGQESRVLDRIVNGLEHGLYWKLIIFGYLFGRPGFLTHCAPVEHFGPHVPSFDPKLPVVGARSGLEELILL